MAIISILVDGERRDFEAPNYLAVALINKLDELKEDR